MAITATDLNTIKRLEILSKNKANTDTPRFKARDGESRENRLDKYNFFFEVLTNNEIIRLSELEALNECYILKKPYFNFFTGCCWNCTLGSFFCISCRLFSARYRIQCSNSIFNCIYYRIISYDGWICRWHFR